MKQFVINIFIFLVLIVLGLTSLYGMPVPDNSPAGVVGPMQMAAFKNGLSLYQVNRPYYYTFSPYSDYLEMNDGTRNILVSPKKVKEDKVTSDLHASHLEDLKNSILSYVGMVSPHITFSTGGKIIRYSSEINDDKVKVSRVLHAKDTKNVKSSGLALNYFWEDFVFDKSGNLYTGKSEEDIADFEKIYGIRLTAQNSDLRVEIPEKELVIVNQYLSSVIVVKVPKNATLWVNKNSRTIEAEENIEGKKGDITSSLIVEVYQSPQEAKKSL